MPTTPYDFDLLPRSPAPPAPPRWTVDDICAGAVPPATLSLGERLAAEIARNLDLMEIYIRLPYERGDDRQRANPAGATGPAVAMLKRDILAAALAAGRGDLAAMITSLDDLRDNR